jgi:hypothetical protein
MMLAKEGSKLINHTGPRNQQAYEMLLNPALHKNKVLYKLIIIIFFICVYIIQAEYKMLLAKL